MFRPAKLTAVLALSCLMLTPALPVYDLADGGAAFAGDKGNGGGNGGGGGGGKSDRGDRSDKPGKADKAGKVDKAGKAKAKATGKTKPAKKTAAKSTTKKPVVETAEGMHPSDLGKMNGALNANINAVLAHIRYGQTVNGPVGLMAGLAAADAVAAESLAELRELEDLADAHAALEIGLSGAGYASVQDYLAAKEAGTVTPEDQALIDGLVTDAGGLTEDGTGLATTAPTDEDLATAYTEASDGAAGVTEAEEALVAAWNKDGDAQDLLDLARERLAPHAVEIAAAVAETQAEDTEPVEGDAAAEAEEDPLLIVEPDPATDAG
jgi:hypothetical protein